MLKRDERLDKKLFSLTFDQGKRINKNYFSVIFLSQPKFKSVVVVGKKIEKKAVKRNQWRRKTYNLIREVRDSFDLKKTGYFIFLLKANSLKLTKKEFRQMVKIEIKEVLDLK